MRYVWVFTEVNLPRAINGLQLANRSSGSRRRGRRHAIGAQFLCGPSLFCLHHCIRADWIVRRLQEGQGLEQMGDFVGVWLMARLLHLGKPRPDALGEMS